jgi:hypothetical protein
VEGERVVPLDKGQCWAHTQNVHFMSFNVRSRKIHGSNLRRDGKKSVCD